MSIWEIDKLIIFIVFVIPGFISVKVYELLVPDEWRESAGRLIDAVTYSCINYALLSWAIYLVETSRLSANYPWIYSVFYLFVLFIFPVTWTYSWYLIRKSQPFQGLVPHPTAKPWDFVFEQGQWYWIIVTLTDGLKIAGKYGDKSFTSSAPAQDQIYLEETWELNEDGGFERPRNQTAGIIITSSDIVSVEFFEFNPEGK